MKQTETDVQRTVEQTETDVRLTVKQTVTKAHTFKIGNESRGCVGLLVSDHEVHIVTALRLSELLQ